jgi:hypothetical protein
MQATGTPSDGTVLPASIASSGNFSFPEVTVTGDVNIADSIIHSGDTDTKIRFPSADTVTAETGGVERLKLSGSEVVVNETGANTDFRVEGDTNINLLFCDAGNDRVGIGINNPATALSVSGVIKSNVNANDGTSTAIRTENGGTGTTVASFGFASGNSQKASIRAHVLGNGAMMFHNNNDTEKMRIDASGNVGIGTTSPLRPLSIGTYGSGNAEIAFGSSTSGVASLLFGDGSTGTDVYRGYIQYNHSADALLIATAATERMLGS